MTTPLLTILDKISDTCILEFHSVVLSKRRAYFNVLCCAALCFFLSRLPLDTGEAFSSATAFHVSNSWLHVGFRPYVWIFFLSHWIENDQYRNGRFRALFLLLTLPFLIGKSWGVAGILLGVAIGLVQMDSWLAVRGSISLNPLLLLVVFCRDHCLNPGAWLCFLFLVCFNLTGVTLPMVHMKQRTQTQSGKVPLLYHGGGPLLLYVRVVELGAMCFPIVGSLLAPPGLSLLWGAEVVKYAVVYVLSQYWSKWYQKTGYDLAKKWNKQGFTLKGWRSATTMGKHLDRLIRRNVHWGVLLTCFQSFCCVLCGIRPASIWMAMATIRQIKEARN
jgi:hypothetical protein